MKKIIAIIAALLCFALLPISTACSPTDASKTQFKLSTESPWKTDTGYEKITYSYQKVNKTSGKAEVVGIMTVQFESSQDICTLTTDLTATVVATQKTDRIHSKVIMKGSGLVPQYSYKKVEIAKPDDLTDYVDYSYEYEMDYANKTSWGKIGGEEKSPIEIPGNIGTDVFDNEQFYWLIRSATNVTNEGNTGTFGLISPADSYFQGSYCKFTMQYENKENTTLTIESMKNKFGVFGEDGLIPCHRVSAQINGGGKGPGTELYYSASPFTVNGAEQGDKVLVRISRPEYNVNTFEYLYDHVYTITDYSVSK